MKKKDIKEMMKSRAENTVVPDVLDEIKKADLSLYKTQDASIVPQAKVSAQGQAAPKRKKLTWQKFAMSAAAAFLVFVLGFSTFQAFKFDSNVYATVSMSASSTASYSIELNKNSKVIDITAETEESKAILQKLSYKQKDFNDTLTGILKACVDAGLISEAQIFGDEIDFTIDCPDDKDTRQLQDCINGCMGAAKQHCQNRRSR